MCGDMYAIFVLFPFKCARTSVDVFLSKRRYCYFHVECYMCDCVYVESQNRLSWIINIARMHILHCYVVSLACTSYLMLCCIARMHILHCYVVSLACTSYLMLCCIARMHILHCYVVSLACTSYILLSWPTRLWHTLTVLFEWWFPCYRRCLHGYIESVRVTLCYCGTHLDSHMWTLNKPTASLFTAISCCLDGFLVKSC